MKILTLAAGLAVAAAAGLGAMSLQETVPPALITEIGEVPDSVGSFLATSADGRLIFYSTATPDVRVYDRARKTTALAFDGNAIQGDVSPRGDRIVFLRSSEDGKSQFIWTIPIDPRTGIATGDPRRVSLSTANNMMPPVALYSPDGRTIAFLAAAGTDSTRIVLVPATGGAERVLTKGQIVGGLRWATDGRSIYYSTWAVNGNSESVAYNATSIDDGKSTRVVTANEVEFIGATRDAKHFIGITDANAGGFTVTTFDGRGIKVGSSHIPQSLTTGFFTMRGPGVGGIMSRTNRPGALRTVGFDGSGSRELLSTSAPALLPAISPDGKYLSAAVPNATGGYDLRVMNADGTGGRTVTSSPGTGDYGPDQFWSPDSRYLAYRTNNSLSVFDVTAGTSTRVTGFGQTFRWRSDSRALVFNRRDPGNNPIKYSFVEVTLDGKERVLRTVAKYSQPTGFFPVGDSAQFALVTGVLESTTREESRTLLGPVATNPGRGGWYRGGVAVAPGGQWIAASRTTPSENVIEVVPTDGRPAYNINQPFPLAGGSRRIAHPDNRTILVAGAPDGNTPAAIYALPIDGGAPRIVTRLAKGERVGQFNISPDGKTLLYVAVKQPTTTFLDVDLSPGLKGSAKVTSPSSK